MLIFNMLLCHAVTNPISPSNVSLARIGQGQFTFNWSAVTDYLCSSVEYIISSDCGDCPHSTNTTAATCSGLHLPTVSNGIVCSFQVNSMVCGITGNSGSPVILAGMEVNCDRFENTCKASTTISSRHPEGEHCAQLLE